MRFLALILCLVFMESASAVTYYVDSASGNDTWSGKIASPNGSPGTDGPWLTLTKVSAASLLPGDAVLLKCGKSWNQTLSIKTSGTASSPITFGVYPTPCATAPTISGSTAVPSWNWKQYNGNIYKATLPLDLIRNSTFDTSVSGWTASSQANDATMLLSSSCQSGRGNCMSFSSGTGQGLAISGYFAISAGAAYKLTMAAKVPVGSTIRAIVRRAASPWDELGLTASITGNGAWQTYSFPFNAKASLANARLDFEVPAGLTVSLDDVRVEPALGGVYGVFDWFDGGAAMNIAHHPNRGYDPLHPDSLYYSIAQDSAQTVVGGGNVSTSLTIGSDFQLPSGAALTPGTAIRIRTSDWKIDERKIASVSGSLISLDQPASYPLYKDWGYFLLGQLWMLDEPGEYFYDPGTNSLYVWMADDLQAGGRVLIGQVDAGIDISTASYVVVDGIAVRNTVTGIRMRQANNVALRNMVVQDILGMGVDATQSTACEIGTSRFARTGREAISGADSGYGLTGFSIHDNDISESGVRLNGSVVSSLPGNIKGAVQPGIGATITRNSIRGTSYAGILPFQNSVVSDNDIENACLVLDDGGAIYVEGQNNNSTIQHNMVIHVTGSPVGKPASHYTIGQGIFLDDLTSGVTVSTNTVVDAFDGIYLHNAANNHIDSNTLYGNRHYQLNLHEDSNRLKSSGDLYGNVVTGNQLFQNTAYAAVEQDTTISTTAAAASYDHNHYFTLLSPSMASETWPTGTAAYAFPQWQSATTSSGTARNLDPLGSQVNSSTIGYATYRLTGSNIVPNGNLANGTLGWGAWNATAPYGQISVVSCQPGKCMHYVAGASAGILSSPNFSVVQGQWYRLSFDLQGSAANQSFYSIMRRGGGGTNGWEPLMTPVVITASTGWQRYSLIFQSLKTINANDPVTGDLGARVDFDGILPGQNISVANVELLPMSTVGASLRTNILVNPTGASAAFDCPYTGTDASFCSQFVRFTDAQPVSWPYTLAARNSDILYSRDSSLVDADGDGIPDSQDACASTPAGQVVNAKGCAFSQNYP